MLLGVLGEVWGTCLGGFWYVCRTFLEHALWPYLALSYPCMALS